MALLSLVFYTIETQPVVPVAIAASWIYLSVLTNVLVTILISFQLLSARRALTSLMMHQGADPYNSIITMLVESALPLSVFGITFAAMLVTKPPERSLVALEQYHVAKDVISFLYHAFAVRDRASKFTPRVC